MSILDVMQKLKTSVSLLVFYIFTASSPASVPPEIIEITPIHAEQIGFKIEKRTKEKRIEFDVEYPQAIGEWNLAHSPRIEVFDEKGKVILE